MLTKLFNGLKSVGNKLGNFYTIGGLTIAGLLLMSCATATNPAMLFSGFFQGFLFDPTGQFSLSHGFNLMGQGIANTATAAVQVGSGIGAAYQAGSVAPLSESLFTNFSAG